MKRYLLLIFCFLSISSLVHGQSSWKLSDYSRYTHENYQSFSAFNNAFSTSNPDYLLLDAALFYMVNAERAKRGIAPMRYHRLIEVAAYNHSKKMAVTDFFSHQNPKDASRKSPEDRGRLAGVSNPSFAENIAYNYPASGASYLEVAAKLMDQWMNSSGHKANILSTNGRQMGCGTYYANGRIYGTQCFQWFSDVRENPEGGVDKLPNGASGGSTPITVVEDDEDTDNDSPVDEPEEEEDKSEKVFYENKKVKYKTSKGSGILTFKLGGYLNYTMGDVENLPTSFDSRVLSGHGTAMLGYRFGNRRKKSCFGVFGSYGKYSEEATAILSPAAGNESQLSFLEIEGGFIFNEWFRLSGGWGRDQLSGEGDDGSRNYIPATVGFSFGPRNFKFELNNTMIFPREEDQILWRPSVGLAIKLDFLRG